ncbi:hypothetical protein ACJJTC_002208 [Scirpophaga incertulas]
MSESKISQLIKKRGSQKCKLTGFCNYISLIKNITTIDSPQILNEIKSRLQKMEILYSEFDALQGQIEELSEDPEERYQERETFENQYYEAIGIAKTLCDMSSVTSHPTVTGFSQGDTREWPVISR